VIDAIVLLVALLSAAPPSAEKPSPPLAFVDVTVIDGTGAAPHAGLTVLVEGDRITRVGPSGEVRVPASATIVDGAGRTLIPGLWDVHVHLSKLRASALPLFVANGVTGVRDTGGEWPELARWRRQIEAGERIGPRFLTAGPYLEAPSNVLRVLLEDTVEPEQRTRIGVGSPAEAHRVVDSIAAMGVDFVKIRTIESVETYRAIAAAAERNGLDLAGHAFGMPPEAVLEARQESIEHFLPIPEGWDRERRMALFRDFARAGTAIVPTLTSGFGSLLVPGEELAALVDDSLGRVAPRRRYLSAYLVADWREQLEERTPRALEFWRGFYPTALLTVREMREAGMPVLPGSDAAVIGVFPGSSLHTELELFVDSLGMTPMEAITSATGEAAAFLGIDDSVGTIAPGILADLVLLDADPLADIANTRAIAGVVLDGRWLDRAALDGLRARVLEMPQLRENDWPAPPLPPRLRRARTMLDRFEEARDPAAVAAGLERYRALDDDDPALASRVESVVNRIGYALLRDERTRDAIEVFRLNADAFPEAANTWDSLAEAHMVAGHDERAIRFYERSLELDPGNDNAREKLAELRGQ